MVAFSCKTNKAWLLAAPSRPVTPAVTSDLCVLGSDFQGVSVLLEAAHAEPLLPSPCSDPEWGRIATSVFSQFSSSVGILPCHFCVLFSVLLQNKSISPPSCHLYIYPVPGIFGELAADSNEHVRDAQEMCFFGCLLVWFFFCGFHFFKISCDGTKLNTRVKSL